MGDGLAGAAFVAMVGAFFYLVAPGVGGWAFAGGFCDVCGRGGLWGLWHKRFFWFHVVVVLPLFAGTA